MATHLLPSSATVTAVKSNSVYLFHPLRSATTQMNFSARQLILRPAARLCVTKAASTTAVEVESTATTVKPSKLLPFRVGHGFDLHRLEPGYPLIIGGINIPHDRGCEAHSDGNYCIV